MTYKVYISSANDTESHRFTEAVKMALWKIQELPLAPISTDDFFAGSDADNPIEMAYRVIDDSDVFIGIYVDEYGHVPAGHDHSHLELEYNYAHSHNKLCLIFIHDDAENTANDRLRAFFDNLAQNHIINTFGDSRELQAKVIVSLSNFKQNLSDLKSTIDSLMPPPLQSFRARVTTESTTTEEDFDAQVKRAIDIAETRLEQIVRRALAVQEAQQSVTHKSKSATHLQTVNPIFGEPSRGSQFTSDIFMITPFRDEFNTIYQNIIKPVAAALNLTIKRGDDFTSLSGSIIDEVWAAINACRLVIVETTEENANVYYELGIAHTLGKPAILISQATDVDDLPFDIRHLRFIIYENSIAGGEKLEKDLHRAIIWLLNDLEEKQASKPE